MPTPKPVNEYVAGIMALLESEGQAALLAEIAAALQVKAQSQTNQTRVISAVSLAADQKEAIAKALADEAINFAVDPKIIGGLVVEQGGRRLDLSLKRTLI
ncbi:MAG: F0F1 ATP synthase subunit delta [bacterium]|nr:F0F1 ATP synthase subunit delta [bacterium]